MIFNRKRIEELEAREAKIIEDMEYIAQQQASFERQEADIFRRKIEVEKINDQAVRLSHQAQEHIEDARIAMIKCDKIVKREKQKRIDTVNAHRRKIKKYSD